MGDKSGRLYINIWNDCNLSCRHCFNDGGKTSGDALEYGDILKLISNARTDLGVNEIQLTGGEPTLRPDLFEIINGILEMGLTVLLQTNGIFGEMTKNRIIGFAGKSLKLIISLDGTDTNEFFRGQGSTEKTLANITALSEFFPVRLNILLSSLIQWNEIEKIAGLAQEFKLDLAFNPVVPLGKALPSFLMPSSRYFDWMKRLEQLENRGIHIRKGFDYRDGAFIETEKCPVRRKKSLVIGADGNTYPCGFLVNVPEACMGNVLQTSLPELMDRTPQFCQALNQDCLSCDVFRRKACNGGCPARIYGLHRDFYEKEYYCIRELEREGMR